MQNDEKDTWELRPEWRDEFEENRDNSSARFQEVSEQNHSSFIEAKQQNEADFEEWDSQQLAGAGVAFNVMASALGGDQNSLKRSISEFNRLLNWHVDSRQIWKAGNSMDQIQLAISQQFLPDILATWEVDQTLEDCTEGELNQLAELKDAVGNDAAFLVMHIEKKLGLNKETGGMVVQPKT